jgi:hypothetical protein
MMAHLRANLALDGLKSAHFKGLGFRLLPLFLYSPQVLMFPLLNRLEVLLGVILGQRRFELGSKHATDLR